MSRLLGACIGALLALGSGAIVVCAIEAGQAAYDMLHAYGLRWWHGALLTCGLVGASMGAWLGGDIAKAWRRD